ncbi:FMN-binding glutamate synthase family protein [Ferroplasma acidiphilum]|uniref:FMN-binding glutamate synthase family protein n=1 Tax=Ferroplasma acidiphilum TaxID=74969 RepID=UPI002814E111|nr:glutamate synthase-related protein [Ferroplasma acidiphilum]WMT53862.1 MAG: glutamate synthase-related protein [Ferroplasma acidiphilum]
MDNTISKFIELPVQKRVDFWSPQKIGHIRKLSGTGIASEIFVENNGSLRILDNIVFRGNKSYAIPNMDMQTDTMLAGMKLSVPVYLGDMSYGALSGNPNIAIAKAAEITETMAGTGEGGLYGSVSGSKRIFVQWASARFGVSAGSLNQGASIVIKIGQGAKPGIGGHLPGSKVTHNISLARKIPENMDAISPAPHHDIYSIEDLTQRIEALKILSDKPVFVKVAATNYIPYIVTGIARSGAAGVIIDGHGAGTGAAPVAVRDNMGIPVELAVASADSILKKENLRKNFTIIAAGRVSNSTDAMKLYALGADVVSLGTSILIAMGCIMVKKCNLGYCPVALTNRTDSSKSLDIDFAVNRVVNFINGFRSEMAEMMGKLGINNMKELTGNRDLLEARNLSGETMELLGIKYGNPVDLDPVQGNFEYDIKYLNSLINKGEPVMSSMGSNAPPEVDKPARIIDWLRLDGAQVTRPSIDPYRENINLDFYLSGGDLVISMPVIINVNGADKNVMEALEWASLFIGSVTIDYNPEMDNPEINFPDINSGKHRYSFIASGENLDRNVDGFILEEDRYTELKITEINDILGKEGIRENYDLILEVSRFRNSGDIIKYLALGCDSVILSSKIFESGLENNYSNLKEKALNFLMGIRKELALLSGAMGISNLQYSIVGNKELLRSVNLDSSIGKAINVQEGGSR